MHLVFRAVILVKLEQFVILSRIGFMLNVDSSNKFCRNLIVNAHKTEWGKVRDFLESSLKYFAVKETLSYRLLLASEEIFVNICNYAYKNKNGNVEVRFEYDHECSRPYITFIDSGVKFDMTKYKIADFRNSKFASKIGERGILICKKMCDNIKYQRIEDKNVLIISNIK